MSYSIQNHERGYNLNFWEGASFLLGCTGAVYANRHLELSKNAEHKIAWGHRIIAVAYYTPIVGGLAALMEAVCMCVYNKFFNFQELGIGRPLGAEKKFSADQRDYKNEPEISKLVPVNKPSVSDDAPIDQDAEAIEYLISLKITETKKESNPEDYELHV